MTQSAASLRSSDRTPRWRTAFARAQSSSGEHSAEKDKPQSFVLGMSALGRSDGQQTVCQLFQRGRCHYGEQCKYAHVEHSEPLRMSEGATISSRSGDKISMLRSLQSSDSTMAFPQPLNRERGGSTDSGNTFPVRSGAADCQYYLKTGKCNYGSRCKFNHPYRDENLVNALNRRDCFDFVQKGTCPYGRNCKYNHPSSGDDALTSVENQSSASSASSSSSSPRSVSKAIPRRSASEPRYSSKRETVGDMPMPREKLLSKASECAVQSQSKWEASENAQTSLARKLAQEARKQDIRGPGQTIQKKHSEALSSAWTQTAEGIRIASLERHGHHMPSRRTATPFPALQSPPLLRAGPDESVYFSHATPHPVPSAISGARIRTDAKSYRGDSIDSYRWFTSNEVPAPLSMPSTASRGFMSNELPAIALMPSTASGPLTTGAMESQIPSAVDVQMHPTHGSIWGDEESFDGEGWRDSQDPSFGFDGHFGNSFGPRGEVNSNSSMNSRGSGEMYQPLDWTPGIVPTVTENFMQVPSPSVALPAARNGYGVRIPTLSGHRNTESSKGFPIEATWGNLRSKGVREQSVQGHHYMQQQMQRQRQSVSLRHMTYQGLMPLEQRPDRSARLDGFDKMSKLDGSRVGFQNDMNSEGLGNIAHNFSGNGPMARLTADSDSLWERPTAKGTRTAHVPVRNAGARFNNYETASNDLWKPSEKSSMFGPGLFGMQPHN